MYKTVKQVTYPIELAWAAVVAADRINKGEYINQNSYSAPAGARFNKIIAYELLENSANITEHDRAQGQELSRHFAGLLFRSLKGAVNNGFIDTISNIVAKEQVTKFDVACMAALPKTYRKDLAREVIMDRQQRLSGTSEYLGAVGTKHDLSVEIIDSIFSRNYNIWIITATDGVNAIKFSTAHDQTVFPVGETIRIKASIKRNCINDRTGAKETWLTRVKRVK